MIKLLKKIAKWYVKDCQYSIKMADALSEFNIDIANVSFPSTKEMEEVLDNDNPIATEVLLSYINDGYITYERGNQVTELDDLDDVLTWLFGED